MPRGCALALLLAVAVMPLTAAAQGVSATADLSVQSAYIWRGMVVNDHAVFQPALTLAAHGFTAAAWATVDLTDDQGTRYEVDEIDYWLTYTRQFKNLDVALTAYDYTFPDTGLPSTLELWGAVVWKTTLSPTLTIVRDVKEVDGWYYALAVSHNIGLLPPGISEGVIVGASAGHGDQEYCHGYYPGLGKEVTDVMVRVDVPFKLGPGTLKLNAQYADFTDSDVHSPGFEGHGAGFFGGATYSVRF
ncbi:MAG: hypothetical protein HY825_00590 [Acidobacteria bacterium]|nr:hypothetical protein [Acidobacteriota bacterium]